MHRRSQSQVASESGRASVAVPKDILTDFPDFTLLDVAKSPDGGGDPFAHLIDPPPTVPLDTVPVGALPPKPERRVSKVTWQCGACTFADNELVRSPALPFIA